MELQTMGVTIQAASAALLEYKGHREQYDKRDWEIERIYRQIAQGKTVISAFDAIRNAGVDELGRPRLAIMRADQDEVRCAMWNPAFAVFGDYCVCRSADRYFEITWPNRSVRPDRLRALLPRIPPQHRPAQKTLDRYHLLWEADWTDVPCDPMLLRRIGKDAWVVVAAWELTGVEMSVLRAHRPV